MIEARVQLEPFDISHEMDRMTAGRGDTGAVVSFTGLVRGEAGDTLELEHYPGMTETTLGGIAEAASRRWSLSGALVIHRYGVLKLGDPIVLVLSASRHRGDAFAAAEFMMDWLKTKAPLWKKETSGGETRWVDARVSDNDAAARWD